MASAIKAAIIGSGNMVTDLFIEARWRSQLLEVAAMVGIDSAGDGLARARKLGVETTAAGADGLLAIDVFDEFGAVFDATSAGSKAW